MDGAVAREEVERAFNVAYRIVGSRDEAREAAEEALRAVASQEAEGPGSALLAATSQACHRRVSKQPHGAPAEAPAPADPDAEVAAAGMRLPVRQREALALDEVGHLSYAQIAAIMEIGDGAVAQLVSRARINLSDELRGTVVASIAAPSPDCQRALPLIATREDGQLEEGSNEAAWLDVHLADCDRCRLAVRAMREAADSYRGWALLPAPASLTAATGAAAAVAAPTPGAPSDTEPSHRSRRPALAAALATLLLVGLGILLFSDDSGTPALDQAADAAPPVGGSASPAKGKREKARKATGKTGGGKSEGTSGGATTGGETAAPPVTVTSPSGQGTQASENADAERSQGETAVEPTRPTATPASGTKPKPAPTTTSTSQPTPEPAPAPVPEEAPPVEDDGPGKGKEPPGKAVGRPPK